MIFASCSTVSIDKAKCDNPEKFTTKEIVNNIDKSNSVSIIKDMIYVLDSNKNVLYAGVLLYKDNITTKLTLYEIIPAWLIFTLVCALISCLVLLCTII
jgi:hypothetical protein